MEYSSAHGWFYTYYYASDYIRKNGGEAGIRNALTAAHFSNLENAIKNQAMTVTPDQLNDIQTQLQNRIKLQNEEVKNLIKAASINKSKYAQEALIATIKKLGSMDDVTAKKIASQIRWNDATQSIYFAGTDLGNLKTKNNVFKTWQPGKAEQYRIASFAGNRIDSFLKLLDDNFSVDQLRALKEPIKGLKDIKATIKKQKGVEADAKDKIIKGRVPLDLTIKIEQQQYDIAEAIFTYISIIKNSLVGINDINTRLAWIYSELVGHLAASSAEPFARQKLADEIKKWATSSEGSKHTGVKDNSKFIEAQVKYLHSKTLEDINNNIKNKFGEDAETYIREINQESEDVQYHLKSQVSAQGKTDAELTMVLEDNTSLNKVGLSFKNYNLNSSNTISLQDSGFLLNYLEDSPMKRFMEHILNIYAKHEEERKGKQSYLDTISNLIEPAKDALYAQLLFSAITGYNQGRQGREADFLVLYKKTNQKNELPEIVKVYSMANIILDMIAKQDFSGVKISPKFNEPIFNNIYEEVDDPKEGAAIRNTKILYQARTQNISVSLAKRILT